jgi:hypothetical protein
MMAKDLRNVIGIALVTYPTIYILFSIFTEGHLAY